jgi:hypothetical protein
MKIAPTVFLAVIFTQCVCGQSTLRFYAELRPTPDTTAAAIQVGDAWLNLTGDELSGNIRFSTRSVATSAQILDSSGAIILETTTFEFPFPDSTSPGAVVDATWSSITLSDAQVQEIKTGQWSSVVPTLLFPNGEIFGQLQLVPEPSTWVLLGTGVGLVLFSLRRNSVHE